MSKRYVIQVRQFNYDVDSSELAAQWENYQHPAGGDWLTRSKTTALNDAVKLALAGETRELRIAESRPVYATSPLAELDVAAAVALARKIVADTAAEVAKYGYGEPGDDDYVAPAAAASADDEDVTEPLDVVALEQDVAPAQFEVVDGPNDSDGNAHNIN